MIFKPLNFWVFKTMFDVTLCKRLVLDNRTGAVHQGS